MHSKHFKQQFFPFLIFIFCSSAIFAEQVVYDMSVFGYTFGRMVVTKSMENDSTELLTLNAKGKTNFLWMKREDETIYEVRFRNGKLISSMHKQIESGALKQWTNIVYDGKQYQVNSYRGKKSFAEVPDFSVLQMHFYPLQKRAKIFHEAESKFFPLVYKDNGKVELKISDANKTIYSYNKGRIEEMEVHLSIATVKMTRVN